MLTSQRKKTILAILKKTGHVEAKTLAADFAVSEDTVRRDLRELAAEGQLQRVHGGAMRASPAVADLAQRQAISSSGKAAIAAAAAGLVSAGQLIILDGGTTCAELARQLPLDMPLTVATHSPSIALALAGHAQIEVILIGGRLYRHSMVAVGAGALEALRHIRADTYFMGVTGVHPEAGYSTGDLEEAHIKRALSAHAAETVVLASSEKLNAASRYPIGALGMAGTLIVERDTPRDLIDALGRDGMVIITA
ncbi:MAG: DeoR/GlpR family DNA-binding transcription regulator [Pseudomonadota bacterium]